MNLIKQFTPLYLYMQVIEYIQFLQEKLQIYEQTYEGWNQEPTKLTPWVKLFGMVQCEHFLYLYTLDLDL